MVNKSPVLKYRLTQMAKPAQKLLLSFKNHYDFLPRKKLPLIAAKPATRPPTIPVIRINNKELLPIPNNWLILAERMLSFLMSIHKARPLHNNNKAINPAKNAFHDFW